MGACRALAGGRVRGRLRTQGEAPAVLRRRLSHPVRPRSGVARRARGLGLPGRGRRRAGARAAAGGADRLGAAGRVGVPAPARGAGARVRDVRHPDHVVAADRRGRLRRARRGGARRLRHAHAAADRRGHPAAAAARADPAAGEDGADGLRADGGRDGGRRPRAVRRGAAVAPRRRHGGGHGARRLERGAAGRRLAGRALAAAAGAGAGGEGARAAPDVRARSAAGGVAGRAGDPAAAVGARPRAVPDGDALVLAAVRVLGPPGSERARAQHGRGDGIAAARAGATLTRAVASRSSRGVLLVAALAAVALLIFALIGAIGSLTPFGSETKDRSGPVLLKSLEDLSQYRAASANLQVVVDVEQDDKLLPSFIRGERTLFVAAGTVDAAVDFSGLSKDAGAVKVSDDRKAVTITLPAATLTEARLDPSRSRVYDRDRGITNRVEDVFSDNPGDEQLLYELATRKLSDAAKADPELRKRAQENTRHMLEGMMRGLGFERVTVRFRPAS